MRVSTNHNKSRGWGEGALAAGGKAAQGAKNAAGKVGPGGFYTIQRIMPSTSRLRRVDGLRYISNDGWFGVFPGPAGGPIMGGLVPAKDLLTAYPKTL